MPRALLIIDYTESCCLERYERPEWGCTLQAVRELTPRLASLVDTVRGRGAGEIVWIRCCPWVPGRVHPNIEALYAQNKEAEFYGDGSGAGVFYRLQPAEGEAIFEKNLYSPFSGTEGRLDAYLRGRNIGELLIAGVYSTGCVAAAVCEAFHHGYRLVILKDCIETFDRSESQDYQRHLLREWAYMYGRVAAAADAVE